MEFYATEISEIRYGWGIILLKMEKIRYGMTVVFYR